MYCGQNLPLDAFPCEQNDIIDHYRGSKLLKVGG